MPPGSESNECTLSWLHALALYIIVASRPYMLAAAGLAVSLTILSPSACPPLFALLCILRGLFWRSGVSFSVAPNNKITVASSISSYTVVATVLNIYHHASGEEERGRPSKGSKPGAGSLIGRTPPLGSPMTSRNIIRGGGRCSGQVMTAPIASAIRIHVKHALASCCFDSGRSY